MRRFSFASLLLCVLAACSGNEGALSLACEGQRRLLRGNLEEPWQGVRQSQQDKQVTYAFQGHKLEGMHDCEVWNAREIRCTHSKSDGSAARNFRFDRESLSVRDQVFTRGRSLTEEVTFEGECKLR